MTVQTADIVAALFWNYLIHSTLSFSVCITVSHLIHPKSYALKAWLWKSAAILPIATSIIIFGFSTASIRLGYVVENNFLIERAAPFEQGNAASIATSDVERGQLEEGADVRDSKKIELPSNRTEVQHQLFQTHSTSPSRVASRPEFPKLRSSISSSIVLFILFFTSCWLVVKVVYFWFCYRQLRRCSKECSHGALRDELEQLLKSAKAARRVRLFISPKTTQPFALGILRWIIVLPQEIEVTLDKKQRRALLAHELGHLVRGDSVWVVIGGFLCTLFAFQPFNFLASRKWPDASEFLADEWAVQHGVSPLNLVRCIVSVAEWRSHLLIQSAMPFANRNIDALTRRAQHLLNGDLKQEKWTAPIRFSANLTLFICGLVIVLFGPHVGGLRAREQCVDYDANSQLEAELAEIAKQLHDITGKLNRIDLNSESLNELAGVPERLQQLNSRSLSLVERAEKLLQLSRKELP